MNAPKAIEYVAEYRLTWSEFNSIPEDQRAALSVTAYAVSEINTVARLYMLSWHETENNEVVDQLIYLQSNVLLRMFSAKVFEFSQLVNLKDKKNKTSDPVVAEIFKKAEERFAALRDRAGYKYSEYMRHEASSHYRLKPARDNLKNVSERARLSLYEHRSKANTAHPLGEETMFVARLNRAEKQAISMKDKLEIHREWFQWNVDAIDWVNETFDAVVQKTVKDRFPKKRSRKTPHWIEPQLVAEHEDLRIPVFIRANSRSEGR
ncbi:MAG: hypothetical protein AB3N19_00840 [Ruegeria sp.]